MKRIWIIATVIVIVLAAVFLILSLSPGQDPHEGIEDDGGSPGHEQVIGSPEIDGNTENTPRDPEVSDEPAAGNTLKKDDLSDWNLIVVSSKSPLDRSFTVDLVETVDGYMVDVRIYEELEKMIADAKQDGVVLTICSAYRSVSDQKKLLDRKTMSMIVSGADIDLAYSRASRYLAAPGESEHHTGLAVDIITTGVSTLDESFEKTDAFQWLCENAHLYGFIIRYPKGKEDITGLSYEPWHFRYVGIEHATAIKDSGLCLEEYLSTAR